MAVNKLLVGEYFRRADENGRIFIPSNLREITLEIMLPEQLYVYGEGAVLRLLSLKRFNNLLESTTKLEDKVRYFQRARLHELDEQHRLLVCAEYTPFYTALKASRRNVVFLGTGHEALLFPRVCYDIYQQMPDISEAFRDVK